eukprot:TRINITY_DN49402_c0_g1_i1.p1 TRINITY_DN49402_c0_g1~~TRINITY_DN49402_c0_g1_i1.p1  ORF type:complete len:113 (-),score=5.28 TRINITY_DN49402_c0_g1_i1:282-620(-)
MERAIAIQMTPDSIASNLTPNSYRPKPLVAKNAKILPSSSPSLKLTGPTFLVCLSDILTTAYNTTTIPSLLQILLSNVSNAIRLATLVEKSVSSEQLCLMSARVLTLIQTLV